MGSPPLARRGPARPEDVLQPWRFTSARTERTTSSTAPKPPTAVHLRSHGEDSAGPNTPWGSAGSPPLARRGLQGERPLGGGDRFTSARTERTPARPRGDGERTVHLRSHGEDDAYTQGGHVADGSPPLARRGPLLTWHSPGTLQVLYGTGMSSQRIGDPLLQLRPHGQESRVLRLLRCGLCAGGGALSVGRVIRWRHDEA